jgi:hypothetical protein
LQFNNDSPTWVAPVARWVVLDADPQRGGAPSPAELSFIDPMLRRRLSPMARMSLKVAHDCARGLPSVRLVYASRHGELSRTTAMLNGLAAGEIVSPTAFSMSVFNASAGLFSIVRNDIAPTTAISAAEESFGFGLLEACLQLASEPQRPVLLVYADEPVPEIYGWSEPGNAHAIAILLRSDADTTIAWSCAPRENAASSETQSRAFLRCLEPGNTSAVWHGTRQSWSWSRQAS